MSSQESLKMPSEPKLTALKRTVVDFKLHITKLSTVDHLASELFLLPLQMQIDLARGERTKAEELLMERFRQRQEIDSELENQLKSTGPTMAQIAAAYRLRRLLEILHKVQQIQTKLLQWMEKLPDQSDHSELSCRFRQQLKPLVQIAENVVELWESTEPIVKYKEESDADADPLEPSVLAYQVVWRRQRDLETRILRFHKVIRRLLDRLQKLLQLLREPEKPWSRQVSTQLDLLPQDVSLLKCQLPDTYRFDDDF